MYSFEILAAGSLNCWTSCIVAESKFYCELLQVIVCKVFYARSLFLLLSWALGAKIIEAASLNVTLDQDPCPSTFGVVDRNKIHSTYRLMIISHIFTSCYPNRRDDTVLHLVRLLRATELNQ